MPIYMHVWNLGFGAGIWDVNIGANTPRKLQDLLRQNGGAPARGDHMPPHDQEVALKVSGYAGRICHLILRRFAPCGLGSRVVHFSINTVMRRESRASLGVCLFVVAWSYG